MPFEKYQNILGAISNLMPRPNGRPVGVRNGMGMAPRPMPSNPMLGGMKYTDQPINGMLQKYRMRGM